MATILEFEGAYGAIRIQRAPTAGEVAAIGREEVVIKKVNASMTQIFDMVAGVADAFATSVKASPVESAVLEFGVQFTAKGSLYIVESEATAAIKVTLSVRPD